MPTGAEDIQVTETNRKSRFKIPSKKNITIFISIILLVSCIAYSAFHYGKKIGFHKGKSEGQESGYSDGLEKGRKEGYESGYLIGYEKGKKEGEDSGKLTGSIEGMTKAAKIMTPTLLVTNSNHLGTVIPQVYILNNTSNNYKNVKITLNYNHDGGYSCVLNELISGQYSLYGAGNFYDNNGEAFKIGNVAVDCKAVMYDDTGQKVVVDSVVFKPDK